MANSNQKSSEKKGTGKLGVNQYGEKENSKEELNPEKTLADVLTQIRQHDESTQNKILHSIISELSIARRNRINALEEDLLTSRKVAEEFYSGMSSIK